MPRSVAASNRVRIEPLAGRQFGFFIEHREVTRWHFDPSIARPYFFPVNGPSGQSLTRMGHPGAPNHDHHRSLWFAHSDLLGIDFWSEGTKAQIRQSQWYAIEDGPDSATIALQLLWSDGHDPSPIVQQDLFATLRRGDQAVAWSLELQSDFRALAEGVEFRKSNFGVLALRVAKSLSVVFGGGVITGADGQVGEAKLFGKPNRWIDYSGPVVRFSEGGSAGGAEPEVVEGLTLIDHLRNPEHPAHWHVRDDGWIGPSISRQRSILIPRDQPLTYRYLLCIHPGHVNSAATEGLAKAFDDSAALRLVKSSRPHHQFEILRP